jgi:hypothetical protein
MLRVEITDFDLLATPDDPFNRFFDFRVLLLAMRPLSGKLLAVFGGGPIPCSASGLSVMSVSSDTNDGARGTLLFKVSTEAIVDKRLPVEGNSLWGEVGIVAD